MFQRTLIFAISATVVIAIGAPLAFHVADQTSTRIERALHAIGGN